MIDVFSVLHLVMHEPSLWLSEVHFQQIWLGRIGMIWRVQQNMARSTALVAGQTTGRIPRTSATSSWHGSLWFLQLFLLVVCVAQHLQQLSKSPRSAMWAMSAIWPAPLLGMKGLQKASIIAMHLIFPCPKDSKHFQPACRKPHQEITEQHNWMRWLGKVCLT